MKNVLRNHANSLIMLIMVQTMAFTSLASAQGIYFDIGLGFGSGSTKINDVDMYDLINRNSSVKEMTVDVTIFKIGYGPLGNIPIYAVLELSGMGHRIYDDSDYIQYNSYLFGPGVIYYPIPLVQLGSSFGYSFVANQTSFPGIMDESDGGIAWNIYAAVDLGSGNHGCLIGLKYFSATNSLKITGVDQNSSMVGVFVKYAYRKKTVSLADEEAASSKPPNKTQQVIYEPEQVVDEQVENEY
jgi:hypothetical protein